jgi:hypothetical protein
LAFFLPYTPAGGGVGGGAAFTTNNFWKDTPAGQSKGAELPPNPPKEKKPAPTRWITGDAGERQGSGGGGDSDMMGTGGSRPVTPAAEEDLSAGPIIGNTTGDYSHFISEPNDTLDLTVDPPFQATNKSNGKSSLMTSGRVTGRQMVPPPSHPGRVADVDVYGNPRSKAIRMKPRQKGETSSNAATDSVHCEVTSFLPSLSFFASFLHFTSPPSFISFLPS